MIQKSATDILDQKWLSISKLTDDQIRWLVTYVMTHDKDESALKEQYKKIQQQIKNTGITAKLKKAYTKKNVGIKIAGKIVSYVPFVGGALATLVGALETDPHADYKIVADADLYNSVTSLERANLNFITQKGDIVPHAGGEDPKISLVKYMYSAVLCVDARMDAIKSMIHGCGHDVDKTINALVVDIIKQNRTLDIKQQFETICGQRKEHPWTELGAAPLTWNPKEPFSSLYPIDVKLDN